MFVTSHTRLISVSAFVIVFDSCHKIQAYTRMHLVTNRHQKCLVTNWSHYSDFVSTDF